MKNEQSAGVSPYTGVRILFIRIKILTGDKQDKHEEHWKTMLNLNAESEAQYAEMLHAQKLLPGDPVPY